MMALHPETMISMADSQYVSIDNVDIGDELLVYDTKTKRRDVAILLEKKEVKVNEFYVLNDELKCSGNQIVYTETGESEVARLNIGVNLICMEKTKPLMTLKKINKPISMIAIKTSKGNFIAEDYVVGHNRM